MTETKFNQDARKIIKTATNANKVFRLIEAVDNIDTVHATKGTFNKKILINLNSKADGQPHAKGQVSFYWDINEALLIADDIITGRFSNSMYPSMSQAGQYSKYGGGQFSRILNIKYTNGSYLFQIALFKANIGRNGAVMPDKSNPVDNHSIQLNDFEARKFMMSVKAHIETKMVLLHNSGKLFDDEEAETPAETEQETPAPAPTPQAPAGEPISKSEGDDMFGSFDGLFG